jgi:hypothetical protein
MPSEISAWEVARGDPEDRAEPAEVARRDWRLARRL